MIHNLHFRRSLAIAALAIFMVLPGFVRGQIASLELGIASQSGNTTGAATFTGKDANINALPTLSLTVAQQGQAGGNGYVASKAWANASLTTTTYWQFTVTAASGYQIAVTSLALRMYRSATGPPSIALATDADSYAATIGGTQTLPSASNSTITFSSLGLSGKTSITFRIYAYGASAAGGTLRIGDGTASSLDINLQGTVTASGGSAPALTASPVSAIGTTSATFNGNISSDGGSAITARGFSYKTIAGVVLGDNQTPEGGTTTGSYSKIMTLSAGTSYFYKAYATNGIGTTLSGNEISFWTYSLEPLTHTTSFTNSVVSQTQINVFFNALNTITNASGYLILQRVGSLPTGVPADGNAYTVGTTIGDGTVAAIVTNTSATSASITSLAAGTHYYFTIFPFNNGANNATYNYKTDGTVPSTNNTTTAPLDVTSEISGPALGSQPNPVLLSSLATTAGTAVKVLDMDVYDYGPDGVPTQITQLTIKAGTNNTANWANTLQGVKLSLDGGSTFVSIGTPTIAASSIVIPITAGNLDIADADAQTISLFVYLKNSGLTDNQILEFKIDATAASHGCLAYGTGSTFMTTFATAPVSNQVLIDVVASKLNFVVQPTNAGTGANITPAVTVSANDANGNRDLNYVTNVSITASGAILTGSPVVIAPVSGLATFSALSFSTVGTGVSLAASSGVLTGTTSNTFDIILLPANGEIVINQFNPGYNGASNEYIELLNKTNKSFDLSQLKIMYSSAGGSGPSSMGTLSGTLPAYSFWLLSPDATVTVGLTAALARDGLFTAGMAAAAGQIALETLGNVIIDGVAYGTITLNKLGEGSPAPTPAVAKDGLKRVTDGFDNNTNSTDFVNVALANIFLRNHTTVNAPPTAYAVTGSGAYCAGLPGIAVGVANSETGVTYTITPGGQTVSGVSGNAITFGSRTAGTYTVSGTNSAGTTAMTGSAVILENPLTAAAGAITGSATVIEGTSAVSYSVGLIANAASHVWAYTGTGVTITGNGNENITLDFATGATSGQLSVYGTNANSCGNGASSTLDITVNPAGPATTTYTGTGNWSTAGNWSNGIPVFSSDAIIDGDVTIDVAAVTKDLTINSGKSVTISSGKSLKVNGNFVNSAGAANLVVKSGGSLIESNGVAGRVEHAISTDVYHSFSPSTGSATANMFHLLASTGLDVYLYSHSEALNGDPGAGFFEITSVSTPLVPFAGYTVYADGANATPPVSSWTFAEQGNLNTGTYGSAGNMTRTGAGDNTSFAGFNYIGNPYPSYINWTASSGWSKTNMDATIYVENGAAWASYTAPGPGVNSGSNILSPGQGFFARVTLGNTTGTVIMNNAVRTQTSTPYLKSSATDYVKLVVTGNEKSDETVVRFDADATANYDGQYDAAKLDASDVNYPQIYSVADAKLAYNALPETDKVQLGFTAGVSGIYNISVNDVEGMNNISMEDTQTGIYTDLLKGSYSFSYTAGENEQRFILHFAPLSVNETVNSIANIYSNSRTVYVDLKNSVKGDIFVYTVAGQLVASKASAQGISEIKLMNTGNYIVKVISSENTMVKKVWIQ